MVSIHVFSDIGGFFSKLTIQHVEELDPNTHFYWFLGNENSVGISQSNSIKSFDEVQDLLQSEKAQKLVFHSLHPHHFVLISKLKNKFPTLKIAWVFWSFEYYQQSFNLEQLYSKYTKQFKLRKYLSNYWAHFNHWKSKKVLGILPLSKSNYQAFIEIVDEFYSFIPHDADFVFQTNSKVKRFQFSYLFLSDISRQLQPSEDQPLVMVGHNGNPLVNHQEALQILESHKVTNEVLIPLSYGKKAYINDLKKQIKTSTLKIQLMEDFLPIDEYYKLLSQVGFYIQPTRCQQGLGNIIYFILSGASVYLCKESSTYQFLKEKGVCLYHLEELKANGLTNLSTTEKSINADFIKMYIADEKVKNEWRQILS